ncbi:pH-response transcription factor pacC/RIM101 [Talaromyces islandicus]|uniref:pH-response transcription factor pacC/RIM101 n=1 Tax=Talaromyces islandicus TaxID=28573 RepID=A0A0U1LRW4_TALIS|nr:pH-response transcription factor pacC/RIM101 [Talaromyces islandicus]
MGDSTPATSAPQPNTTSPATVATQSQFQNVSQAPEQSTSATTSSAAQAQAQAQAAAAVAVVGNQNGSSEDFVCMWQGCSERCTNAEALYEHVCERHVGRKSTNNLNLTCQWGNCRTTTVKRDHITSHIRVHVPLKPHKCDLCGKAFKRPQDLKKHVKTHADDSVLIRSPGPPDSRGQDAHFGMVNNPKGFPAGGHYFEQPMNPVHAGQNYHQPPQYYQGQPHPQPNPAYGNVYYTLNQGDNPSNYDSRKRIFESVNDFFGDTKRRQFDPTSYAAIGQRLGGLQGLQLPMSTGPAPDFQGMHGAVGVAHAAGGYGPALAAPAYHLPPMSNARTKHDLIELDRMLDTIHTTVYENDDHVAAAGIAQPGATYIHRASYGTTHQSPPVQLPSSHLTATTTNTSNASIIAASSPGTTPALTPPSSTVSYASSHSPGSYSHRVSPPQQEMAMYPRLPSTSAHDMAAGYVASANAAPPSTLSNNGDYNERRRWTGGVLERSRPDDLPKATDFEGPEDRERTPTGKEGESKDHKFHSSLIDPALQASASSASSSASSTPDAEAAKQTATDAAKRAEEEWLENVRILEQLRAYVKDRLSRGDYESLEVAENSERPASTAGSDQMEGVEQTLVGNARPVNASANENADANPEEKPSEAAVLYPTLKMEDDGDAKME